MKKKLLSILIFLCAFFMQAQETSLTAGGESSGSGGTISYSVGQTVYETSTGSNGKVITGVQQSYEITNVLGFEEVIGINLSVAAYPNPTANYLTLKVDEISNLTFQLYDTYGRFLQNKKISSSETKIDMTGLAPAIYFLKVNKNNKEIKIIKIVKK